MGSCSRAAGAAVATSNGLLDGSHFATYAPLLRQFFRRKLRDAADVEDLVQDVFLRFATRRGVEIENLTGYLFQTAASVLADRFRRRQVRHSDRQVPFDSELHGEIEIDASRVLESRQALESVFVVLDDMPERTRKIFMMRRLEGYSFKDIASDTGTSVSAVEKHMARAMKRLMAAPALH